jgi:hypothetical protein
MAEILVAGFIDLAARQLKQMETVRIPVEYVLNVAISVF